MAKAKEFIAGIPADHEVETNCRIERSMRYATREHVPPELQQLADAFDYLEDELVGLSNRWLSIAPQSRISAVVNDYRAFMHILLEDVELRPVFAPSSETQLMVHDTFVRLITVAGLLREGMDETWANLTELEIAYAHAEAMLDAFTPFVGLADRAMRRICLQGETLEAALAWLARELDQEAADRLRSAQDYVDKIRTDPN